MTPADYRLLPYKRVAELVEDDDGSSYFVARVVDIPWIRIDGDTPTEALLKLDEIFDDCIESLLEAGREIPPPTAWPGLWGAMAAVAPKVEAVEASEPLTFVGLTINRGFDLPEQVEPWAQVGEESEELRLTTA